MSFSVTKRFLSKHPLTKNNLFAAYCRFFKWQIISRMNTNSHLSILLLWELNFW